MMLLPMVAVNALAQLVSIGNISYSLSEEETAKVIGCSEIGNGVIEIPSTVSYEGKEYSVTAIGSFAFHECTKLKSIIIPNGVTTIGESFRRLHRSYLPYHSQQRDDYRSAGFPGVYRFNLCRYV